MIIVFVTARKQSLRRLCFYTCLSVILFTGEGEYLGRYTLWAGTPPGRYTPTLPSRYTPLGRYTPPRSRYTPPWEGTPPSRYTPPGQVHPPGAVHAGRYGQQAGGTHPTGMHSSLFFFLAMITRVN